MCDFDQSEMKDPAELARATRVKQARPVVNTAMVVWARTVAFPIVIQNSLVSNIWVIYVG